MKGSSHPPSRRSVSDSFVSASSLTPPEAAKIVAASFKQHVPLAFFVGAGVSRAPPSALPVWAEFRDALLTALFARLAQTGCLTPTEKNDSLHDLLTHVERCARFPGLELRSEVVLERLSPYLRKTLWAMLQVYAHGTPNLNHHVLAHFANSGHALVATCNFDRLIERASRGKLVSYASLRRTRHDRSFRDYLSILASPQANHAPLLKIHGCAGSPATIKATLSHVSRPVPRAHRESLNRFIHDRLLVVAGYRGDDSDILPEIEHAAAASRGVLWLTLDPDSVPPGMRRPVTRPVVGDLNDFFAVLSELLGFGDFANIGGTNVVLADQLEKAATAARPIDICIGLSELATHIGCWSAVELLAGRAITLTFDPRLRALAWMSLGDAKRRQNPPEASHYFKLAARALRRHASRYPGDYGHCLKYLAAQQNLLGPPAAALKLNSRALTWIRKGGDRASFGRALDDRANILRRLKGAFAALRVRHRAIHLLERVGDRLNLAMVYNNLGKDYDALRDLPNAERWWRKALEMKERESSNGPDLGRGRFNLAELLRQTGRLTESLSLMVGAWHNARTHRDRVIVARSLYGLAALGHDLGKTAQAIRLLAVADSVVHAARDWSAHPERVNWAAGIQTKIRSAVPPQSGSGTSPIRS